MALPVWSKFAKHLPSIRPNVKIAQVDCVKDADLCQATKITGYPTFIMFKGVNPLEEDYGGERSIDALSKYVEKVSDTPPDEHNLKYQWQEGCLLGGRLLVNRVPGNFHISAKSDAHNFDQKSTNTSHLIHHLSFGGEMQHDLYMSVPEDIRVNISPLDDILFINHKEHMSHEHYIKVVSTHYQAGSLRRRKDVLGYQVSLYARLESVAKALASNFTFLTALICLNLFHSTRWQPLTTSTNRIPTSPRLDFLMIYHQQLL